MVDSLEYTREQLCMWAKWVLTGTTGALGHASCADAAERVDNDNQYDHIVVVSHDAERIESILVGMKGSSKHNLFLVIKSYYLSTDTILDGAKRLRISPATYKTRKLSAEHYIEGLLVGNKLNNFENGFDKLACYG